MKKYYALNELDVKLEEYLDIDNGLFFEAGANDGENQSNTCYFARSRGWTGILVEPIVDRFKLCRTNRHEAQVVWAALVPPDWPDPFVELTYGDLMTVTNSDATALNVQHHIEMGRKFLKPEEQNYTFHAPARTITSLCEEKNIVSFDLMSIDLEGFEAPALRGIDFNRISARFVLVECWNIAEITAILNKTHEVVGKLSYHDYLFRKREG